MKSKPISRSVLFIFLALFMLFVALFGGQKLPAFAATASYTDVLEDLKKDKSFNAEEYPYKADDFTIQIIQIAESTEGDLLLYTYQPCQLSIYFVATRVNMSLSESVDETKLYELTLLSNNGVFCKYKVNDLKISSSSDRFYNISTIYRAWVKQIDGENGTDNKTKEVGLSCGQLWIAKDNGDSVDYILSENDVVVITNAWNGTIRYNSGFVFYESYDAHFVAFSCDHKIDELLSADIFYKYSKVHHRDTLTGESYTYGEERYNYVTVEPDEVTVRNHLKKTTWNRITTVSDFIKNEKLTAEAKNNLQGLDWVLRFWETEYSYSQQIAFDEWYTIVTECTILRLEFQYQGRSYNLGVVDNIRYPDEVPDNPDWKPYSGSGGFPWYGYVIIGVVLLVFLPFIVGTIFPSVGKFLISLVTWIGKALLWLFKGLWWLICLPFRGIASLVKKRKAKHGNTAKSKSKSSSNRSKK